MYNSKLVNLILKLEKEELSTFNLYLKSPYFVKSKQQGELQKLFTFILKNIRKSKFKKLELSFNQLNDNNPDHLFQKFLFEKEAYQYQTLMKTSPRNFHFHNELFSLDAYYLLQKLEHACFCLSHHRFIRPLEIEEVVEFLQTVRPLYEKRGVLKLPIIKLFYKTFDLLLDLNINEWNYLELKKLIVEKENLIPFSYRKTLAGYLRNFIIFHYNRGNALLLQELFNVYQSDIEKGYLFEPFGVIPSTYKNVITIGLRSKSFDWTYAFLEQYKDKIVGIDNPSEVYCFNLARYHFYKCEFEQALDLLADQYVDIFYKISAKRLELKVYFEMKSELLDAKMDAFKIYIFRLSDNSIHPNKRESDNNFINFLRQIRNPKTTYDLRRIDRLEKRIQSCLRLSEREWLLEKLEKIKIDLSQKRKNLVKRS